MGAQRNMAGYICGYVGDNKVGEKGSKHLSKVAWGELEKISLGHCSLTQGRTPSVARAAGISIGEIGHRCKGLF